MLTKLAWIWLIFVGFALVIVLGFLFMKSLEFRIFTGFAVLTIITMAAVAYLAREPRE